MNLKIEDSFCVSLPGDTIRENYIRTISDACFSFVAPTPCSRPKLIHVSDDVLCGVGLRKEDVDTPDFLKVVSGCQVYPDTQPYAMCYGGHQFGSWAGQLGDGRAINMFETVHDGQRYQWQLKGAGKTPYSRSGDGLAVLRSSVREYLCSESMFFLSVPTTRALSLVLTGDEVLRDMLYDGHPALEKGAIVCRLAPTFIRFGNFQILAARGETENLKKLTDYTMQYFYPHLGAPSKDTYLAFFREVMEKTIDMVIHWQRVGFVHGVMNTDNMSILGLTIDYGPYGWLENFDPGWTPNTTDAEGKRYRFGNQPAIVAWNLYQLANALYPLILEAKPLEDEINSIQSRYEKRYLKMMKQKLGLNLDFEGEKAFIVALEDVLFSTETDMTLLFRRLGDFDPVHKDHFITIWREVSYSAHFDRHLVAVEEWLQEYSSLLQQDVDPNRKIKMNQVNPKYVLRNYMAQIAIDAADNGDYSFIDEFYRMLQKPYEEQPEYERWFAKRPDWALNKVGCSMLSCSS